MASSFALLALIVVACAVTSIEARALPASDDVPIPLVMDVFGSPLMFVRDKRASYRLPYPQRAMMFTGFYRPSRSYGDQASGIYAQGNLVGGGAYLTGQPQYLKEGPDVIEEPEIASADAEAAPAAPETEPENEEPVQQEQEHEQEHKQEQDESTDQPQDSSDSQDEKPADQDQHAKPHHQAHHKPTHSKKGKKMPFPVEEDEEDDEEEEDDDNDTPVTPFVSYKPTKGLKNRNNPTLNNFFPMVFSFPRGIGRRGSGTTSGSDATPGLIAAIANSYSTGKGGVASSVATAYGGSPTKKPRRTSSSTQ